MARDPKIEVAAVNLRIPDSHDRDYTALICELANLQRGVKVYGHSFVAIRLFLPEENHLGLIAKYTEIDIDGDWFDLEDFDAAKPEKLDEINIPDGLKPNLAQFYFQLFPDDHIIVVSSYAESKSLSTRSVERYFKEALSWPEITEKFGRVEIDIVKNYRAVDELLSLPDLKEVKIVVRRPNTDDLDEDLASVIEERLKENNGDQYEETIKSNDSDNLTPSARTHALGKVAAENGEVHTKSLVNGVMTHNQSASTPLIERTTYDPSDSELNVFQRLSDKVRQIISDARRPRDKDVQQPAE